MFAAWVIFHVLVSISLILVVLMQSSKGEGLAGTAFGGSISGAVFGGRGAASFLSKSTTVLAVLFMLNCAALAYMSSTTRTRTTGSSTPAKSVVTKEAQKEREKMLQQQQQQQQQAVPSADSLLDIRVLPNEGSQAQPTEPAGK